MSKSGTVVDPACRSFQLLVLIGQLHPKVNALPNKVSVKFLKASSLTQIIKKTLNGALRGITPHQGTVEKPPSQTLATRPLTPLQIQHFPHSMVGPLAR